MNYLTYYVLGLLAASSMMMAWFCSSLPIHVFYIAKFLGYRKNDGYFWELIPHWESGWDMWADAVQRNMNPFMGTLLTCKYCLSFHAAFWAASFTYVVTGLQHPTLVPVATFTWPVLIIILLNKAEQ